MEPVLHPAYWEGRLRAATRQGILHHAVFRCPEPSWRRIEEKHRQILSRLIGRHDSVLDAGCGWGRLLDLMPPEWEGPYLGVDLSPDFIALARQARKDTPRLFAVGDLRDLSPLELKVRYDWAVLVSVRPMIKRNCGDDVWDQMEAELRRHALRLLYLEYDETDNGSVE